MTQTIQRFRTGYIVDQRQDYVWFLALPLVAVVFALTSGKYFPGAVLAAIALWITIPHHFVTWMRVYGSPGEFARFKDRFIWGPIVLIGFTYLLLNYAPLSLVLIVTLWDHQHSLMQQYGFARVYDFKAKTGAPSTAKFDLFFSWIFFLNMLIVSPLFSTLWIRIFHEWHLLVDATHVQLIQNISWIVTGMYGTIWLLHIIWTLRNGYAINPLKYAFLGVSYFLWYFTSFSTEYLLVYAVAHRIMHGVQYIVMVYFYNRHKIERGVNDSPFINFVSRPGNIKAFLLMCVAYALVFHALTEGHVRDFGFGFIGFNANFDLFSYSLLSSFALIHYYYDAFIWKVRKKEVQEGL